MEDLQSTLWIGSTYSHVERVVTGVLESKHSLPRPMAIYREGNCLLTPGEYIENPWYFSSLLVSSYDVEVVVIVYRLGEPFNPYPPAMASAFNRDVLGVLVVSGALDDSIMLQIDEGIGLLRLAGVIEVCLIVECSDIGSDDKLPKSEFNISYPYGYESLRNLLKIKE